MITEAFDDLLEHLIAFNFCALCFSLHYALHVVLGIHVFGLALLHKHSLCLDATSHPAGAELTVS